MTSREIIYKKYDLPSVSFSEDIFDSEWGRKLTEEGFREVSDSLKEEGGRRKYLAARLSSEEVALVNATETLKSAKDAGRFQQKVAETSISENFEKLVDLRTMSETTEDIWTFTEAEYHEACGQWAGREKLFLVRESVAIKLSELAERLLRLDTKIHFEDGFRPLGVQEGLFVRRIAMARASHPEWNDDELILEARSKTAYTPRFAAHKAGAAVDVRLYSATTGAFHDIGHDYPDGGEIVRLNTEFVTQHQWQNRKILEYMARVSGFSMYPYEDWHLCYGDATAAVVEGVYPLQAKYGPIKDYDAGSGKILGIYSQDELDRDFLGNGHSI